MNYVVCNVQPLYLYKKLYLHIFYSFFNSTFLTRQIEEYMEQLDNTKIPKIGSQGEKYRDIQIVVQLPKQDLAQEFCRHLKTPDQKKAFEEFRHVRDATAMVIGIVREVTEDTVRG